MTDAVHTANGTHVRLSNVLTADTPGHNELPVIVNGARHGIRVLGYAKTARAADLLGAVHHIAYTRVSRALHEETGREFYLLH